MPSIRADKEPICPLMRHAATRMTKIPAKSVMMFVSTCRSFRVCEIYILQIIPQKRTQRKFARRRSFFRQFRQQIPRQIFAHFGERARRNVGELRRLQTGKTARADVRERRQIHFGVKT